MIKITTKEYDKAINFILEFDRSLPKELRSEVIIQNGHISHPGVSDLDIIFFLKMNFLTVHIFYNFLKDLLLN